MYAVARPFLLVLLWIFSLVELGLTGARINHTEHLAGFHEGIVAALLATAVLTMLWVPYALFTNLGRNRYAGGSVRTGLLHEGGGGLIVWIMWLVCAAIFTNDIPAKRFCGVGRQCDLLIAIQAIAWICFSLLTIYKVMLLMHASAQGLIGGGRVATRGGVIGDKPVAAGPGRV
ncbi:hypothetical protein SCHPADRAFT_891539 [Schizopora paradoxa]|uniref:Uncharacterized protein n=1 Tax=Schizopora paradoxa TaxID=27342 RepID=A0A0H2RIK5_9AGAM|nr:hypothetical protein SCHPADRAFT_891539 [Schizopora paradoxa]